MSLAELWQALAAAATHYKPGLANGASSEKFMAIDGLPVGDRQATAIVLLERGLFAVDYTTAGGAWRMLVRAKVHFGNAVSVGQLDLLEGV